MIYQKDVQLEVILLPFIVEWLIVAVDEAPLFFNVKIFHLPFEYFLYFNNLQS